LRPYRIHPIMKVTKFVRVGFSTIIEFDNDVKKSIVVSSHTPPLETMDQAMQIAYHNAIEMQKLIKLFGLSNRMNVGLRELLTYSKWLYQTGEEI